MDRKRLSEREVLSHYERHGGPLTTYAWSFGLDFALAQDAVEQVFLKLLSGEHSSLELSAGYLYRAVRNTCLNRRRDTVREVPLESRANWLVHPGGDREAEFALQGALAVLPEQQREVVIMRLWDGMSLEEVAAGTATSVNTAAPRYRYALQKLRVAFRARESREGKANG